MRYTILLLSATALLAQSPDGAALFKSRCATCHAETTTARIPTRSDLAGRTPETVVAALNGGVMASQAQGLTAADMRALAVFVTGKEPSATTETVAGQCTTPVAAFTTTASDWNGAGMDAVNSRFQAKPGLSAADVPKLKLKWAFGFAGDKAAFAQPSIVGNRVFTGSAGGTVYSLDAKTGCIIWSYKAGAGVRTSVVIGRPKANGPYVAYFGDIRAFTHAVDASTGAPLWKVKVEDHPGARVTGAPAFFDGKLYVPVSSIEEGLAQSPQYECCKFRGSVVALDGGSGKQIWKTYTVSDPAIARKQSKTGSQLWGPAGAAVWSSPTIDAAKKLVYVATGDSYTDSDIPTSDAVIAMDMATGKIAWASQVTEKDNFIMGCPKSPNCPDEEGPDADFGTSPILRSVGNGKRMLVVAQKSGIVWGLDPDQKGKVIWQTRVGSGGMLGGIEWGHSADDNNAYVAVSDRIPTKGSEPKPGLSAVKLATGEKVWSTPAPKAACEGMACSTAQSAPVAVIPGIVFSGSADGQFRAYATGTGAVVWEFNTAVPFETVNKVQATGGSIDAAGPVIANGMVLTPSGYSQWGGKSGNVLLAFTVDGK